jgi:hypothetical protein
MRQCSQEPTTRSYPDPDESRSYFFKIHLNMLLSHLCPEPPIDLFPSGSGFEVLTVMVMKDCYLLGYNTCSPLKFNRRFGETCRLHFRVKE